MSHVTIDSTPSGRGADKSPVAGYAGSPPAKRPAGKIFVIDDEYFARDYVSVLLRDAGWSVEAFTSCEDFLAAYRPQPNSCVVLDVHFPGMGGIELLRNLDDMPNTPPIIVVSGKSSMSEAVQSMKSGALDFIEKPLERDTLLSSVERAFAQCGHFNKISAAREAARDHLAKLTARQHEITGRVLDGQPSKNIAADLGISQRTVENHRATIMHRTGARSLPALAQMVMCNRCALAT